jgi:outer membrane protein assembly factor BamD
MEVYANYRIGKFDEAILAADRYWRSTRATKETCLRPLPQGQFLLRADQGHHPRPADLAGRHRDLLAADLQLSPQSEHAKDAKDKLMIGYDQLAGKEMSVGRYYLGNGQYAAAINRFRTVVASSTRPRRTSKRRCTA